MAKELLFSLSKEKGDFKIETFRSGGKGGQHQNTTDSGVRIVHVATGLTGESRTERSQKQNMKLAFKHLTDKKEFKNWIRIESARRSGTMKTEKQIQQEVEDSLNEKNIKTEIQIDGKWVEQKV